MTHVNYQFLRVRPKQFSSILHVPRKLCTYLASTLTQSPNGPKSAALDPRHVGVPSGVSKIIYEPMVRSMQTMHLSCVEINTVSKWTDTSFHLTHVT